MSKRFGRRSTVGLTALVALAAMALVVFVGGAGAVVAGAGFTSIGPDPYDNCFSGPGLVNCNLYQSKDDVWMNGGPSKVGSAGLSEGTYYFEVTDPSGATVLSTDSYTDRTFTVDSTGEISAYTGGTHLTDGAAPNLLIQLSPYLDTPNPGGEYKMAICLLTDGTVTYDYPSPDSACKYDNFKVRERSCDPDTDPECQPPTPFSVVSGLKYYDANRNGQWDPTEAGIPNWNIDFADGVANTLTTDSNGQFSVNLPADTNPYTFTEEVPTPLNGWVQTGNTVDQSNNSSLQSDKTYSFLVNGVDNVSGLNFGNVCEVRDTGGLTLGFWSNSNGQLILAAHDTAWRTLLNGLNLYTPKPKGNFDLSTSAAFATYGTGAKKNTLISGAYFDFRTWLLGADASKTSDMAYMLSAQMAATFLDYTYGSLDPNALVKDPSGNWVKISDLVAAANTALGNLITNTAPVPTRSQLEAYKNIFDKLNNNLATVTPSTQAGCQAPTFS
jgi:hypothetical protein